MLWIRSTVGLLALICAAPTFALAQNGDAPSSQYVIRPGDMVRISVWNKPEWSGDFEVKLDGTLKHAQYNQVKVAGVPLSEVRARIATFLAQLFQDVPVEIEPLFKVTIGGEVRLPNVYSFPPETTLSDALTKAGGATERGRPDRVTLIRGGHKRVIDLNQPSATQDPLTIQSGDQITVDRRGSVLRDFIGPVASVTALLVSVMNLARR
jgi:protein involved in polysaccharide export with SLBB domain